jgi:hypothetical protein
MKNNKEDVFNISVTEILLIIMFSLLVVMVILSSSLQKEINENKSNIKDFTLIKNDIYEINKVLGIEASQAPQVPEEHASTTKHVNIEINQAVAQMQALIKALKRSVESPEASEVLAKMKIDDVWTSLAKVNKNNFETKELLATINKLNEELAVCINEKLRLEAIISATKDTDKVIDNLQKSLTVAKDELSKSNTKNKNLIGQVENLSNGLELPPCWATEEGKIQYTYLVTVHDEYLELNSIYPEERSLDYKLLVASDFNEKRLSLNEFKSQLNEFYTKGVNSTPECRFFVQIEDKTSSNAKEQWKLGLKTVESIFYKYERQ